MFVVEGDEQNKQNGGQGGQENNNNHDDQKRWFLVCEADYMNLNNTGDDPQPINLMREEYPADQYYLSCDDEDDDKDYTHSNRSNNYSPFFNVNVYNVCNHTSSNDLFHLRQKPLRIYQQTTQGRYKAASDNNKNNNNNHAAATTDTDNNYSTSSKFAKKK
jgi:hypothetical protein